MKAFFSAVLFFLTFGSVLQAEDKNGFRVSVQKTTLARDDERRNGYYNDTIDRTLGLKVDIKNIAMTPKVESVVDYSIIVSRWSYSPSRYEKYTGSDKLPALKQQESATLTMGKARIAGYADYANRRYQDKVEAWEIVIKQAGVEVARVQSGSSYQRLAEKSVAPAQ